MANIVDILRGHSLLHGVPDHELSVAAATMSAVSYRDGETIIKEGADGTDCFFIVSGEVRVMARSLIGRSVQLATLGPGALIGEIALLSTEPRTATVCAAGPVDALRLDRDAFQSLSASSPFFHESLTYGARIRGIHGLLSKASIWSSIPDSELRGLAEISLLRQVKPGEVIVREGEPGREFYTVGSGSFEVRIGGKRVAVLGRGDYFGEIALLAGVPRTATVTALEEGQLLSMGQEEFGFILKQYEPVKRQFLSALGIRMPDLAEAAARQWTDGDGYKDGSKAPPAIGRPAPSEPLTRLANRQRWVDVLLLMGGLFLATTLLAIWLGGRFWVYAALLVGGMAGPVTFVAYARSSQLLGFRLTRLVSVFLASAVIAGPLALFVEKRWLFSSVSDGQAFSQLHLPLSVALIEEASKLLICYFFLRGRKQRFKMDAVVFGASAGMGFAAIESVIYGWNFLGDGATGSMLAVLWMRGLLSPFGHGTWTAIAAVGIWLGLRRSPGGGRAAALMKMAGLLAAAVLLHTLWDYHFASGLLRIAVMAAAGAAGIMLLLRLIRTGSEEELQALTSLNPELSADRTVAEEPVTAESTRMLTCQACGTLCPPDTRYCPRCGQALRLNVEI
ncbi:cyclic nucleotide-binding domain-containing protein [Paenibacillus filicis]|uniref:Cyclic nucleotide-binding domain-containing protein n=1 Tax=Paenibacillus filicis TaxID=669464 RepID=A0ABU9DUP7_9BACL